MARSLLPALVLTLLAAPAAAQVYSPYTAGDRHRDAMERLRIQADQRDAFARQQAADARLTVLELQAARQRPLPESQAETAPRTLEQRRAERESQTRRREAVVSGVGEIDAWLDRGPQ